MRVTWGLRFFALVLGVTTYLLTFSRKTFNETVQQPITAISWGVMGICMITIFVLF